MAVKWRLGAWLRALRWRDFCRRLPPRSAAALCPLRRRKQPQLCRGGREAPLHLPATLIIPSRQRAASFRAGNEPCLHVDVCADASWLCLVMPLKHTLISACFVFIE